MFVVLSLTPQFTPESGQGANQAIESAAALANHVERMLNNRNEKVPDPAAVRKCLASFEAKRQRRSKPVVEETNRHVRLFTYSNPLFQFLFVYIQPLLGDIAANKSNDRHIGAERVDFLPIPSRSVSGTMGFNPTQGVGLFESAANRALHALPLLAIGFFGRLGMTQNLVKTILQPAAVDGQLDLTNRSSTLLLDRVSSAESWSNILSIADTTLVNQYPLRWFLVDVAPVYLVWLMEANRRANYLKPIQLYVSSQIRPD